MSYRYSSSSGLNPVWVIIGVNLIVFIATLVNPDPIFYYLGLTPDLINVHPWALITNIFVHNGFFHIFFNMITLYFFGIFLLRIVGDAKFLLIYFGGGLLGSLFFLLLAPPYATAVGASGAIFALGGALAVIRPRVPVMVFPIPAPIPLWIAVIGGFFVIWFLGGAAIAWQAHLGGIIFGLLLGYYFRRTGRYYY